MIGPFLWLIDTVLWLYLLIVFATVIMSWLLAFGVVNGSNPYVRQVNYALRRLTEPLLAPIRRFLPDLGGIDISPIILVLAIIFLRMFIPPYVVRPL